MHCAKQVVPLAAETCPTRHGRLANYWYSETVTDPVKTEVVSDRRFRQKISSKGTKSSVLPRAASCGASPSLSYNQTATGVRFPWFFGANDQSRFIRR